jgi:predicted ArsR family transcriptional regulator
MDRADLRRAIVDLVVHQGKFGTAGRIAEALGRRRGTVQSALDELVESKIVRATIEKSPRGRPKKIFCALDIDSRPSVADEKTSRRTS